MTLRNKAQVFTFIVFCILLVSPAIGLANDASFDYRQTQKAINLITKDIEQLKSRQQVEPLKAKISELITGLKDCEKNTQQSLSQFADLVGDKSDPKVASASAANKTLAKPVVKLEQQLLECKYLLLLSTQLKDKLLKQASQIALTDTLSRQPYYWSESTLVQSPPVHRLSQQALAGFAILLFVIAGMQYVLSQSRWASNAYVRLSLPVLTFLIMTGVVNLASLKLTIASFAPWIIIAATLLAKVKHQRTNKSGLLESLGLLLLVFSSTIIVTGIGLYQSILLHGLIITGAIVGILLLVVARSHGITRNLLFFILIGTVALELLEFHVLNQQILIAVSTGFFFVYFLRLMQECLGALGVVIRSGLLKNQANLKSVAMAFSTPGVSWIYYAVLLYALGQFVVHMVEQMGLPQNIVSLIQDWLVDEVRIGSVPLAFHDLILASLIFGITLFGAFIVKTRIEGVYASPSAIQNSSQTAKAALFWYSAILTATLIAFSVAGFNVQNLAIIAGAFSVGIGFGLQNIVSNFVSGLILLIERPVKPGDWIVIGNTEGLVIKISIRATQIRTFDRADILVPNSELISNQVTNLMLGDDIGRLKFVVGVAYGSDTEKVAQILLEAAQQHEQVINNDPELKPSAVLQLFNDSSIDFEVRCFLLDVKQIFQVRSDLLHAIYKAFKANEIEIPFPQRDVYIKQHVAKE